MGWLNAIFSSKKIVNKAVDLADDAVRGIGTYIDELSLTEEEKAKYTIQQVEAYQKFLETARDESSVRSVTRRVLVFVILAHYSVFSILTLVLYQYSIPLSELSAKILSHWDTGFTAAISFYLGRHILSMFKGKN